jgi:hypothetical protein
LRASFSFAPGTTPWYLFPMKIQALAAGMKVRHSQYGEGVVESVSHADASVLFSNIIRTVDPEYVEPVSAEEAEKAKETADKVEGKGLSLKELVESTLAIALKRLGFENPNAVVDELGTRWHKGKMVLHPADPNLQPKEIPLEIFFHKIVGIRNQLRVLEQKINSNEKLTDADKIDLQQYISRSYGSLTTFNLLFKNREDQFSSKGE